MLRRENTTPNRSFASSETREGDVDEAVTAGVSVPVVVDVVVDVIVVAGEGHALAKMHWANNRQVSNFRAGRGEGNVLCRSNI